MVSLLQKLTSAGKEEVGQGGDKEMPSLEIKIRSRYRQGLKQIVMTLENMLCPWVIQWKRWSERDFSENSLVSRERISSSVEIAFWMI